LFAPLFPLLCYDIVWNEGVIKPITMVAPEGTIVNCTRPAPVSVATVGAIQSVNNAACSAIGKMLAASDKYADEATAVWHANHFAIFMFGNNQRGRLAIGILTETFAGAGGARTFADGVDIGGEIPNPISRMANVETIEAQFPIRYLFRRRLKDSGGAGEYRGGAGGEMAIVAHDAPDGGIHYVVSGKGTKFPQSEGLSGGYPGGVNDYVWVHAPSEMHNADRFAATLDAIPGESEPISWGVFPLMGNDALYVRWNGGGGVGDPLNRPAEKVLADIGAGLISEQAAAEVYGVVGKNGALDQSATKAKRTALRDARLNAGGRP
jgi:N-methylhydantoinase B